MERSDLKRWNKPVSFFGCGDVGVLDDLKRLDLNLIIIEPIEPNWII